MHSHTSTDAPLKFGNGWIISSHALLGKWLIINKHGEKWNLYFNKCFKKRVLDFLLCCVYGLTYLNILFFLFVFSFIFVRIIWVPSENFTHGSRFAVFCCGVLTTSVYLYPSGILRWHWGSYLTTPLYMNNMDIYIYITFLWLPARWAQDFWRPPTDATMSLSSYLLYSETCL